jgi:hypothetical protein
MGSLQEEVARTDEIFLAHVVRAQEVRSAADKHVDHVEGLVSVVDTETPPENIVVRYRLLKALKGDPRQIGAVHTRNDNCSATLLPDNDYVLFVARDTRRGIRLVRSWPYGTRQYEAHDPRSREYVSSIQGILSNPPEKNSQ